MDTKQAYDKFKGKYLDSTGLGKNYIKEICSYLFS